MSQTNERKMMTNEEINKAILFKFESEIKYQEESMAILKLLYESHIVPNDLDWLYMYLKSFKMWKLEKAIKELKAFKFIEACAVDYQKLNNRKDSWKLTNRGTRLVKELFKLNETKDLSSLKRTPSCCRGETIATMMFDDLEENAEFYGGSFLFENLTGTAELPYRGSNIAGYFFTDNKDYLVYYLPNSNIPVFEKRKISSLHQAEMILNKRKKADPFDKGFNKIIIVEIVILLKTYLKQRKRQMVF